MMHGQRNIKFLFTCS